MSRLKVLERVREAADCGNPFAEFELGLAYDWGEAETEQNLKRASEWYTRAAKHGHTAAAHNLLLMHVLGQANVLAPKVVFARVKKLAESGDLEAQNNLGLCYQFGFGTAHDFGEAKTWFRKSANAGLPTAQFNLAGLYFLGHGVVKSLKTAAEWYTRAAEQRHELALLKLGSMYQNGFGLPANVDRAFILYLIAYKRGSVRAANHLGFMFKKGLGVKRDDSLAYELYLESVNGPDTPEIAENRSYHGTGYYWLGYMKEHGEGVVRDIRTARRWYRRGAVCGDKNCLDALARLRSGVPGKTRRKRKSLKRGR